MYFIGNTAAGDSGRATGFQGGGEQLLCLLYRLSKWVKHDNKLVLVVLKRW